MERGGGAVWEVLVGVGGGGRRVGVGGGVGCAWWEQEGVCVIVVGGNLSDGKHHPVNRPPCSASLDSVHFNKHILLF